MSRWLVYHSAKRSRRRNGVQISRKVGKKIPTAMSPTSFFLLLWLLRTCITQLLNITLAGPGAAGPPTHSPRLRHPSNTPTQGHFRHRPARLLFYKHTVQDHLHLGRDAEVSASALGDSGLITAVMMASLLFSTDFLHCACWSLYLRS